jgi:hypothetical protein
MWSFFRILRALRQQDAGDRIRTLRLKAARDPRGIAAWILAIKLWGNGEIDEARGLAEAVLQQDPTDFYCLAICLDFQTRSGNSVGILEYARRLTQAEAPVGFRRGANCIATSKLSPLSVLGQRYVREAAVLSAWAQWAQDYVKSHTSVASGT